MVGDLVIIVNNESGILIHRYCLRTQVGRNA